MISETHFVMNGGDCRQVNLVSPTECDEYPYQLSKMKTCLNSDHCHYLPLDGKHWNWNGEAVTWNEFIDRLFGNENADNPTH